MCSERDCNIFRGMITACDGCNKWTNVSIGAVRMPSGMQEPAPPQT